MPATGQPITSDSKSAATPLLSSNSSGCCEVVQESETRGKFVCCKPVKYQEFWGRNSYGVDVYGTRHGVRMGCYTVSNRMLGFTVTLLAIGGGMAGLILGISPKPVPELTLATRVTTNSTTGEQFVHLGLMNPTAHEYDIGDHFTIVSSGFLGDFTGSIVDELGTSVISQATDPKGFALTVTIPPAYDNGQSNSLGVPGGHCINLNGVVQLGTQTPYTVSNFAVDQVSNINLANGNTDPVINAACFGIPIPELGVVAIPHGNGDLALVDPSKPNEKIIVSPLPKTDSSQQSDAKKEIAAQPVQFGLQAKSSIPGVATLSAAWSSIKGLATSAANAVFGQTAPAPSVKLKV